MTHSSHNEEPTAFDSIIEKIGNAGPYQKRFNWVFNFFLVIVAAMPHLNLLVSLAVPDHWCHVPGRESTNYTLEEWKELTIPKEPDSRGVLSFSKCKRFSEPFNPIENVSIMKCNLGWEYDNSWYDSTAPMDNQWVCDDSLIAANTLALSRVGEVVGTLIFGHFADHYGRRPVFFATVVTLVVGRVMSALTSVWIYAFFFFALVGSLPSTSVFQGPLVIAMEISRAEDRAHISMMQCFGWNVGMIILPLSMWWLRDWVPFLIGSSVPCALFLFSRPWMIESPRWLASKGKIKQCMIELGEIAKTNQTTMPYDAEAILTKTFEKQGHEKNHNVFGLFSSPRLAKNTTLIVCCWAILLMIYMCLTINVSNLEGNPFLNYLLQALAEIPSYIIGKYVSNHYGRRWTSFFSFILTAIACTPILFLIHDVSSTMIISGICIFLKFSISLAFYSINLQSMEIYPTCVRQTGISVGVIFGSGFGVVAPYIVAIGVSTSAILPYLIYIISSILAAVCCLFLPETYGHQLPETLADASKFGADQDFWGKSRTREHVYDGADLPLKK